MKKKSIVGAKNYSPLLFAVALVCAAMVLAGCGSLAGLISFGPAVRSVDVQATAAGDVDVRKKAAADAELLVTLPKGSPVNVTGIVNADWLSVRLDDGRTGYVNKSSLTAAPEAVYETEDWTDSTVNITKYKGWDAEVVVPTELKGKTVAGIGESAFANWGLTAVTIPDSVIWIGDGAFSGNQLTGLTIGKGLIGLGEAPFSGNRLTSVTLGEKIIADLNAALGVAAFCEYVANDRKAGTYTVSSTYTEKTANGLNYVETKYGAVITGGIAAGQFQIPEKIGGQTVKGGMGLYG